MKWINLLKAYLQEVDTREVCVNGIRGVIVVHQEGIKKYPPVFNDGKVFRKSCQEFALQQGVRLDPYCTSSGGVIDGGSYRWHCIISPQSVDEAIFVLRKHQFKLIKLDSFNYSRPGLREEIEILGQNRRCHIMICGPTGSGKTSFLSAFLKAYSLQERVVILEDINEISLLSNLWLSLKTKVKDVEGQGEIKFKTLLENSLRLCPDRFVVGELRTVDSLLYLETLFLGHYGSLCTIHAKDSKSLIERIKLLSLTEQGFRGHILSQKNMGCEKIFCITLERGRVPNVVEVDSIL